MGQTIDRILRQFAEAVNELQIYGGLPKPEEANKI
jgi:hypothetical protein